MGRRQPHPLLPWDPLSLPAHSGQQWGLGRETESFQVKFLALDTLARCGVKAPMPVLA